LLKTILPKLKIFSASKLDVHRRVFPGGAQITTTNNPSMKIKIAEEKGMDECC